MITNLSTCPECQVDNDITNKIIAEIDRHGFFICSCGTQLLPNDDGYQKIKDRFSRKFRSKVLISILSAMAVIWLMSLDGAFFAIFFVVFFATSMFNKMDNDTSEEVLVATSKVIPSNTNSNVKFDSINEFKVNVGNIKKDFSNFSSECCICSRRTKQLVSGYALCSECSSKI